MRLHASNPPAGYEVGVTNALTRKVLMTTGQKLDPPSPTRSRFMPDFKPGKVARVAGPVIVAEGMLGAQMYEVVRVGDQGLIGEIIKIDGENATVHETTLITQRIMVPPNQSGKIISIVPEGDYTITEPIGEMETKTGPVSLFMMHTWPVRIARPFKRKLPSEIPLITGQRIIDFFFPVANGGTAAFPGPLGSRKCLDGETPVLLADGRIRRIRELVHDKGNSRAFDDNGDETLYSYSNPPRVVSLSNPEFTNAEASMGYKGSTNELLEIQTRSGRKVRVTPVHKLQQLRRDGTIEETPAKLLQAGGYLLTPRKNALHLKKKTIKPYKILPYEPPGDEPKAIQMMVATIDSLRTGITLKAVAKNLDVSYSSLQNYRK